MFRSDPGRVAPFDRDLVKDRIKREALAAWLRSQQAHARQYAHRMETLANVADAFADDADREVVLHAAGIARMGQGSTATQLETARRLRECFPRALLLLKQGRMFVRTAEILLQATKNASDEVQREVGRRITDQVAEWDAADVSRRVAAVLPEVESELEEQAQRERHERAKANRGMWVLPIQDGMARIGVETDQLSAAQFAAAFDEIDRAQAEVDRRDGVKRCAGQRRADLLSELPARYLALCQALQEGRTDDLLAQAAQCNQAAAAARAAAALGVPAPVQAELELGLPPAGPPRAWQLSHSELVVQLLRVAVDSRVRLNAHVPATTLLELDQRAMRLDVAGHSYLPAFHARGLLPTAELRRVLVDHLSGVPIAVDELVLPPPARLQVDSLRQLHPPPCGCRHDRGCPEADSELPGRPRIRGVTTSQRAQRDLERALREQRKRLFALASAYVAVDEAEPRHAPSASLRALVQLRDQTDRGIGSSRPARSCDLDHRRDWAKGGPTAAWNLDAEGKRTHRSKDDGWTPTLDEATRVVTWTSPLGFTFRRYPAWDPPPPIGPDATIPPVKAALPTTTARDREEDPDRPFWRDPRPGPRDVSDTARPETLASELPQEAPAPELPRDAAGPEPPRRRSWESDDRPPF